jgi:hypothetical protein
VDYSIRFIGHVREKERPPDWPATIENWSVLRIEGDMKDVMEYLGIMGTKIKREEGLWATTDLPGQQKSDIVFGRGVFVPMHMFSHVSFSARAMSGEMPDENDTTVFTQ